MEFMTLFPEVRMELTLEDRFVDLVNEGFDAAIRVATLADSSLIARKLADFRVWSAPPPRSSPPRGGRSIRPSLLACPCVLDTNARFRANWPFQEDAHRFSVPVTGRIEANSPYAVAAAAGRGSASVVSR
jgi:DNA-binding transcriptional LysR family regulator